MSLAMSLETRSNSALFKRAEQLKRWEDSDTNREPVSPRQKSRRIKFSSGCVFLAACAAGDKDEVTHLLENGADINTANVDGLTALHQACIDDNLDMVEFLVDHGADVNRGDNEGWTPLHATSSCGFQYIAKYLIEKGGDVAAVNNDGELAVDIAECQKMEDLLNEEIKKRGIDCETARNEEKRLMLRDATDWLNAKSGAVDAANAKTGATALHVAAAKGYTDVIKVLLQCGADIDVQDVDGWTPLHAAAHWGHKEVCQMLAENLADMDSKNFVGQTPFDLADTDMFRYLEDLKKKQNKEEVNRRQTKKRAEVIDRTIETETPSKVKKVEIEPKQDDKRDDDNDVEKKNRVNSLDSVSISNKNVETVRLPPSVPPKQIVDTDDNNVPSWRNIRQQTKADPPSPVKTTGSFGDRINSADINYENDVNLRRAKSLQTDKAESKEDEIIENVVGAPASAPTSSTKTTTSPATSPVPVSQAPRRSFVPPVRDEESETQRKAHAKRVRETRRSTQGVTLEEIKSAEQLVKKKNNNNNNEQSGANGDSSNGVSVTATITTASPTVITREVNEEPPVVAHERRPSWRLQVNSNKFMLEDATKPSDPPASTPSFARRTSTQNSATSTTTATTPTTAAPTRPTSAPAESSDTTTVTLPFRRPPKTQEDKEQDKENDVRNAQATLATQAAIQRRRRPKRRSTGVVTFDSADDPDQEKDPVGGGDYEDASKINHQESGTERSSRSRLGSTVDIRNENGEIDYKKLYEQALVENDQLKDKLRKSDTELRETKQTLEKLNNVTSKNSLSELEKRERRAMERKLSEMEEELKHLENMKIENQKLKDENGALIRVISKLSK